MERRILCKRFILAGMAWWYVLLLNAQTNIAMPFNSGPVTFTLDPPTTCSFIFTDNGAGNNNYSPDAAAGSVITFRPSSPGNKIVVQFSSFHTEPEFDGLFVYDGPDIVSPQISSAAKALLGNPKPFSGGVGAWQGSLAPNNVAPGVVRATTSNVSGALTFAFSSDASIEKGGWVATVSEVPGNVCAIQAPGALSVAAPDGTCSADVQTALPVIQPGACSLALELRYRLNNNPAVSISAPFPPSIILQDVPVGLSVISWQLVEPCAGGLAASAAQLITVSDQTPPVIQVPPSLTLNLDPGACTVSYSYLINAIDDCYYNPGGRVEHPVDFDNATAGVMFDVKNLSADTIVLTEFGPVLDAGEWPVEVYVTTNANSWQGIGNTPSGWTHAGVQTAVSAGPAASTALEGFHIVLPPGVSRGIYLASAAGAPIRVTGTGIGIERLFKDGTLQVSSAPGASVGYAFGELKLSRAYNGYVRYTAKPLKVQQTAGLPSDADFPIGTTANVFKCTDNAGNEATASFSVTVKPYADPVNTLICAGVVNASLGPTCSTTLGADDILIGGPYTCFDAYTVQIDKIPPLQDGPWVPAVLNSTDVGKTYGVRVADPFNGNVCHGMVLVEDKLPPSLTGTNVDLPCNFNTDPTFSSKVSVTRTFSPAATLPVNVTDFKDVELEIPVVAQDDAVVEDLDMEIRATGDVFEKNLWIELESPDGTRVILWQQPGGCSGTLWARLDDEGLASLDCSQFSTNQRVRIPLGSGSLADFDGLPVSGTWILRIRDLNGFSDVTKIEAAFIHIQYKATMSAGFPSGLVYPDQITQVSPNTFVVPAPLLDGCSDVVLSYSDEQTTLPCSTGMSAKINRTWTARDASNNTSKLVQVIRLVRPGLNDVVLPPDYNDIEAPAFDCSADFPTPGWIEGQGIQGFPYVFGRPEGCSINWSFEDVIVNNCAGSYTLSRTWSIVDACTALTTQAMQLIQVLDRKEPVMTCPANLTVSTDLYNCCATVNLPDVVVEDACSELTGLRANVVIFNQYSGDTTQVNTVNGVLTTFPGNNPATPDTLAAFGNTSCLPIGVHHVYYKVEDACGNLKSCSFSVAVRDFTPPVAVGHSLTTVGLNGDDPNDCYEPGNDGVHFAGVTTLPATVFDQGSYDNCNFIRVTVRRVPPYSDCIEGLNADNGTPPCNDDFPDLKSEYARATEESDSIRFYCCEAGTTQTLALRCYQLNALGQNSLGPDGKPLFNETLVQVEVQDKLNPGCKPPPDVIVLCENFDQSLAAYGLPDLEDNCCLDAAKNYQNKPGLSHTLDDSLFDSLCNRGILLRTFTVFDCQGQTSQCTQKIEVTRDVNYAIRFPDDVIVPVCDSSGFFGQPELFGKDCELLGISYTDAVFTVVPDACYYIERTWRVIDWCDHLPGSNCITVPNPTPNATLNAPDNLPGPTIAPPGTPAPWSSTIVKVTPNSPSPTDYSSFWDPAVNCYEYTQVIKVLDTNPPVVGNCPDDTTEFGDLTLNAGDLWNESYWYDDTIGSHNLCEGPTDLKTTGTGVCAGAALNIQYHLFLDLDGDGTPETVVNSADLPPANTLMYGNALNPNFTGGTLRAFDERPVSPNQKYGFALQKTVSGSNMTAAVRWNTPLAPDDYVIPELPYGKHEIRWTVSDGCGNETVCSNKFVVKDAKAPTVACINGLSINIMPNATVTLWATDFLQYAEDNYTPFNQLRVGIRLAGTGTGFPFEANGNTPQSGITFTCDDLGTQVIELWVMDVAGNADYCETYVIVQDNLGACTAGSGTVAGTLKTEFGEGLENATVLLSGTHPAIPPAGMAQQTASDGGYVFNGLPLTSDFDITPSKNDDPLNGVSTFDLVLINKHILGLTPLNSPYKMIAADANNSRSITTFDIVELRKLILGIYTGLPDNTSWRFVDNSYVFPNPANPFEEIFSEAKQIANLQVSIQDQDFISVKVGDVNGNALTSSLTQVSDRTSGELLFDLDDRKVYAGETFTVNFNAAELVKGYQFTLRFPDMEVVDVTPGTDMTMEHFGIFNSAHSLTTSFDNDRTVGTFAVTFRARAAGTLSQMLRISSSITKAEAYSLKGYLPMEVGLRFNGQG
ncbi:MAG: hypothetical protein EP344_10785, partial [Bacteroidetes bacterium]